MCVIVKAVKLKEIITGSVFSMTVDWLYGGTYRSNVFNQCYSLVAIVKSPKISIEEYTVTVQYYCILYSTSIWHQC